jgi:hypothetical protein
MLRSYTVLQSTGSMDRNHVPAQAEACGYKKLPLERNSVFINLPLWMKGRELVEIARGAAL